MERSGFGLDLPSDLITAGMSFASPEKMGSHRSSTGLASSEKRMGFADGVGRRLGRQSDVGSKQRLRR